MRRLLLCVLLLCSPLVAWSANTVRDPVVLVFGDSLSAAYNLSKEQGWVADLQRRFNASPVGAQFVNASQSGETTAGGRSRLPAVLKQHKPTVVILQLGANDGLRGLPLQQARSNLEAMIKTVQQSKARVLLVGIKLPPNYGKVYTDQLAEIYLDLAKAHKVALVPFMLEGIAEKPEFFLPDGLHPNSEGQSRVGDNIWPVLLQMMMEMQK